MSGLPPARIARMAPSMSYSVRGAPPPARAVASTRLRAPRTAARPIRHLPRASVRAAGRTVRVCARRRHGLRDALERWTPATLGRQLGQHLLVVAGRAVAEQRGAEPVDIEHRTVGERRERVVVALVDCACCPRGPGPPRMLASSPAEPRPSNASTTQRSPLPRTKTARSPRSRTRSSVSTGSGPGTTPPPSRLPRPLHVRPDVARPTCGLHELDLAHGGHPHRPARTRRASRPPGAGSTVDGINV